MHGVARECAVLIAGSAIAHNIRTEAAPSRQQLRRRELQMTENVSHNSHLKILRDSIVKCRQQTLIVLGARSKNALAMDFNNACSSSSVDRRSPDASSPSLASLSEISNSSPVSRFLSCGYTENQR